MMCKIRQFVSLSMVFMLLVVSCLSSTATFAQTAVAPPTNLEQWNAEAVRPYSGNNFYWEYKGEPLLLLGGSWQDNLFNHPTRLEEHLDVLMAAGGNYLRNVMSHRNAGNEFAFVRLSGGPDNGTYDLNQFNEAYWDRYDNFLRLCYERDIIVQIEIWATHDKYNNHQTHGGWSKHPFNPDRNVNYNASQSNLQTSIGYGGSDRITDHRFFKTVPEYHNNTLVLGYQQKFVDKVVSKSLKYPNVLYTMNNETGEDLRWGHYWVQYVKNIADAQGKEIFVTDMRRHYNTDSHEHNYIADDPVNYNFIDISQINAGATPNGDSHYFNIRHSYNRLSENANKIKPMNCNKIYAWINNYNDEWGPLERFFRLFFGGMAAARHHRPHPIENPDEHLVSTYWGLGLNSTSQTSIKSMRMLSDEVFFPDMRPDWNFSLLPNRGHLTYAMSSIDNSTYMVLFQSESPRSTTLNLSHASEPTLELKWLDVFNRSWTEPVTVNTGSNITLTHPGQTSASNSPGGRSVWVAVLHSPLKWLPPAERIEVQQPVIEFGPEHAEITVTAENKHNEDVDATIITGLFDTNNQLKTFAASLENIPVGGSRTIKTMFSVPSGSTDTIKIFVWDNLKDMNPLTQDSYEFPVN